MGYVYNNAAALKQTGMDEIVNNERLRASSETSNPFGTMYMVGTGTPTSLTGATGFTLTTAQLSTGIITINSTAAGQTVTTPTAAQIVSFMNSNSAGVLVGDYLQVLIINGGATNAFTIAGGTSVTFDANQANTTIAASTSKFFNFRVTNATAGSEAVVAYW